MSRLVKKMRVSVIVPLYKGKKYISSILKQIDENVDRLINVDAELILYNDYPNELIEVTIKKKYNIVVINSDKNQGIHGARVQGLSYASGDYIVFLDQDDYLYPEYLLKQINKIGNADFCVCKLLNGDRKHYTKSFLFDNVVCKDFMMRNWCSIVSPGQVLIRKAAIPKIWIDCQIKNNGADDYFLWLSMFGMGRKVQLNHDILFSHRITGANTSLNTNQMMDSEEEVINILIQSRLFNQAEENDLIQLKTNLRKIHVKQLDNLATAYMVNEILYKANGDLVRTLLKGKMAIYGVADIGRTLYRGLTDKGITPILIDRNARYIEDLPVITFEETSDDFELIILAVNNQNMISDIRDTVKERCKCTVLSVHEFMLLINEKCMKTREETENG